MHQCRFTGARWSHDRDELAFLNVESYAFKYDGVDAARMIGFFNILTINDVFHVYFIELAPSAYYPCRSSKTSYCAATGKCPATGASTSKCPKGARAAG